MRQHSWAPMAAILALGVSVVIACGSETPPDAASPDGGDVFGEGGASGGLVPVDSGYKSGDGASGTCVPYLAADGTSPQCSDCKDNDGDGKADWQDPDSDWHAGRPSGDRRSKYSGRLDPCLCWPGLV